MARPKKGGDVVVTNIRLTKEAHRWLKLLAAMRDQDISTAIVEHLKRTAPEVAEAIRLADEAMSKEQG